MWIDVEASKFADFMERIVEGFMAVVDTIVVAGIELADEDEDCQCDKFWGCIVSGGGVGGSSGELVIPGVKLPCDRC